MMTIENESYKVQIIEENAEEAGMTPKEYVEVSADQDPNFFRWLFGTDGDDFECPCKLAYNDFLSNFSE